ncbi:LysR family transcriptional regulator [Secundilactobacillus malefermentans]|uniref:LysR family transcriptional regulator n=1 Tax=Secundilactobacillus malefermentans TaxID=176292 RepID=UPI0011CB8806|nr:LysR family transcriptional regulator [Secundilactobacillus malefermentans]QEA32112.1 LysR family transcriptional regulator [Secundilactobacillus malefermentans]
MKLSTLTYFVEVATELSFTKASKKLFISQPTLTRHVQELETELGVALFVRHSHTLKLTSEGEKFLIEVTDVLARVDHLSHLFDDQKSKNQTTNIIKIGYLPNFNMGGMYEVLNRFKGQNANVQFLMNQDSPLNLAEGVTNGHYDLVFGLSSYFESNDHVEKTLFMENHLQIAMPIHSHLSEKKKLKFSDLKKETFILLERQQSPVIVDYVISQGLKNGFNLKASHYINTLDEGLSMVAVGKGLAFLYSGMNDGSLEAEYHIKIGDIENVGKEQNIIMVMSKENKKQMLRKLYAFVRDSNPEDGKVIGNKDEK